MKTLYANILKYLLIAMAILYIVMYLGIAYARIQYPFALEWMEGGSLEHVQRILDGKKLYVPPSLEFIPYIYPPLYFYVSALASHAFGNSFTTLRLISCLASVGCFFVIFVFIKQETRNSLSAFLAVGLFAAAFPLSGAWFDVGRIDSLFLCLALIGVYFLKLRPTVTGMILAAVFLTLSFLTKQTALVIALPLIAYNIYSKRRRSLWFIVPFLILTGGTTWLLDIIHNGWYRYYILELPKSHALAPNMLVLFWTREILPPLAIAICGGLFYIRQQLEHDRQNAVFYMTMVVGMLGGAWMSRMHTGSYLNVLLPGYAVITLLFGISISKIIALVRTTSPASQRRGMFLLYGSCIVQFLVLVYDPLDVIPTSRDREAGYQLIAQIAQIPGDVYIPRHGYLAVLAGKKSFSQEMALNDVLRGNDKDARAAQVKTALTQEMRNAISEQRFSAIVLDYQDTDNIVRYYPKFLRIFEDEAVFWPVSGMETRPEYIYLPEEERAQRTFLE